MKKLLLTMLTILTLGFFAAPLSAQSTLTVHDGTATNGYVPVYGFYADAYLKAEFVYPASELTSITTNNDPILGLTFYATQSNVSWGNANFQVFLTEVTDATLSSFVGNSNATIVYEGSLSIVEGEMFIEFTTPYTYNGGNLLVGIYNTAIGSYVSSTWMGENVTGASVQGYSYQSLGDISASQHDFLPKTTFTYGAPALCAKPQNVTVPSVTTTDATISWVGSDDASSYTLQYMLASQTDWDEDAEEETSTDTAITLTNLTPGTTYQVRVRAICSDNNPTAWAPTVLFNTLNIPIVLPYFQDFETDPNKFRTSHSLTMLTVGISVQPRARPVMIPTILPHILSISPTMEAPPTVIVLPMLLALTRYWMLFSATTLWNGTSLLIGTYKEKTITAIFTTIFPFIWQMVQLPSLLQATRPASHCSIVPLFPMDGNTGMLFWRMSQTLPRRLFSTGEMTAVVALSLLLPLTTSQS